MPWLNETLPIETFLEMESRLSDAQWEGYVDGQLRCRGCSTPLAEHLRPSGTCPSNAIPGSVRIGNEPLRRTEPMPARPPRTPRNNTPIIQGDLVTSRKFGIEIELIHLNTEPFRNDLQRYNIPFTQNDRSGSTSGIPTQWILKHDGSVAGMGLELVSPPLAGVKGLSEIKLVTELVKANGGKVDGTCGFHVHHSASDLTDAHLKNLLVLWYKYQDLVYGVANPARANNRYCNKLSQQEFDSLHGLTRGFGAAIRGSERYRGLNFAALNLHNTVEFRLLEGTLNSRLIEAWITLTQRIVRVARYAVTVDPAKVGTQFQLLGAVTKMLSRNGYVASEEEQQAFNLLSSYYHKNMRGNRPARRRNVRGMGE